MFKPHKPDPLFDQCYNPDILADLRHRLGPFREHHIDMPGLRGIQQGKAAQSSRRAEVIMVIPNEQGKIWLQTKPFYPPGIFRLMTGGLNVGEAPVDALVREVKEETDFETTIERCLAVITYQHFGWAEPQPFVSYMFLTDPVINQQPTPTDPHESISGYMAVLPAQLRETARQLQSLNGDFGEWGNFRAIAHEIAAASLLSE